MRKFGQKLEPFQVIFIILSIVFSIIIFLSIPSLFDYKKIQPKLEKSIESNYHFFLKNISETKYRFLPSPHLVVSKGDLQLTKDPSSKISTLSDIKIFISLTRLYNNKEIDIKKIKIKKENFTFNKENLDILIDRLYSKRNNDFIIEKSKIFLVNEDNQVTLISPITKLFYKFNDKTNQKKLNINGNVFDTKFDFDWFTKKDKKNNYTWHLTFRDPTIQFENETDFTDINNKTGLLKTYFLNNKNEIKYSYNENILEFKSIDNKVDKLLLNGKINKKPFYFDINLTIKNQKIDIIINNILLNYYNYKDKTHKNLNGKLKIKFQDIQNSNFKNGNIVFNFSNGKLFFDDNHIKIKNIGNIKILNNLYYEKKDKVFFAGEIELAIENQEEFYRKFSIPKKNRQKINKIYAVIEKNIDNEEYFIYNFSLNDDLGFEFNLKNITESNKIPFNNLQQLRKIIRAEFESFN